MPPSLVLSVIPPKLPADGGAYPAVVVSLQSSTGKASLALNDTVVYLTSSEENVGSISSQLTIVAGTGFAVANFSTSTSPGTTTISASSVGLTSASTQVTTVTPSGFPSHLKVIPIPGVLLVNPAGHGTIIVETLDAVGLPAKAVTATSVTLSSSNNNVLSLPDTTLTIPAGAVISSASYDTNVIPGNSTITASASGFNSGSGAVTVEGPLPFDLKIFAQPDPIVTSATGRLVVTVTDPQGDPARAPAPITVTITSSNNTIVSAQQTATIASGQIYAVTSFTSGGSPGAAILTASSPGLMSDFANVSVTVPAQPVKLKIMTSPTAVLPDKGQYNSILVTLTDAAGNPAITSTGTQVILASSDSPVGSVSSSVNIGPGLSYAVATFTSTFYVGSTIITASAQNLLSASTVVSSYGNIPGKVVVQALPATLPADGGNYSGLDVILEDANGAPAIAPVDVMVHLDSSRTDIATVNSTVVISAGQTYALTDVATTISPGTANVTASSSGFDSSSTNVITQSPAPSQLAVYVAPASGIQSLGQAKDALLAVQLQDSTSSPARARQDTPVVVTSSNSSVISKPIQLDIPAGADYAWALVATSQPGSSVLTASTSGLSSASASLSELSLPISVTLTSSAPAVSIGTPATLLLQVEVLGAPLAGANVTITATSGVMSPPSGVTDSTGQFSSNFVPEQNGVATITAAVSSAILGNQTTGTNILVTLSGGAGAGGSTSHGLGVAGSLVPIVLVVVVVVIIALGARRIVKSRRTSQDVAEQKEPGEK